MLNYLGWAGGAGRKEDECRRCRREALWSIVSYVFGNFQQGRVEIGDSCRRLAPNLDDRLQTRALRSDFQGLTNGCFISDEDGCMRHLDAVLDVFGDQQSGTRAQDDAGSESR